MSLSNLKLGDSWRLEASHPLSSFRLPAAAGYLTASTSVRSKAGAFYKLSDKRLFFAFWTLALRFPPVVYHSPPRICHFFLILASIDRITPLH